MSTLQQFLSDSLTDEQRAQIIRDFEQMEADGCIGDCLLRETTERFLTEYEFPTAQIILTMNIMAFECYRVFANKWLDQKQSDEEQRFF